VQRDAASVWEAKACHSEGRGDFTMAEDEEGLMSSNVSLKGPGSRGRHRGTTWFSGLGSA